MDTPFGCDWVAIQLDALDAFFRNSDEGEGLTWEAKADIIRPAQIHKAASGFGNSALGGYLVLGAKWDNAARKWTLPGVALGKEPKTWLSSVINSGTNPSPRIDVKSFATSPNMTVAVVRFVPVPNPPSITADGRVFERTVGQTLPVSDPSALARLFARGEEARSAAETLAEWEARAVFRGPPGKRIPAFYSLALVPTGIPKDLGTVIFRRSFVDSLRDRLFTDVTHLVGPGAHDGREIAQDRVSAWLQFTEGDNGPLAVVTRRGAVVGAHAGGQGNGLATLRGDGPATMWTVVSRIAGDLGLHGPAALHMEVQAPTGSGSSFASIKRWTSVSPPSDADVNRLMRELDRAAGSWAFEPEQDQDV